jgi:hypothetical protein
LDSSFEVVEERADGRIILRFTEGVLAGRCVTAFSDEVCARASAYEPILSPRAKADRLLVSLLDEEQHLSWRAKKRFRLSTPYGVLEFGALFNMAFWPRGPHWDKGHVKQFHLCVVPRGDFSRLPEADIWTNLLLVVRAEPERFFGVANWWCPGRPSWYRPPMPGLRLRPTSLRSNLVVESRCQVGRDEPVAPIPAGSGRRFLVL